MKKITKSEPSTSGMIKLYKQPEEGPDKFSFLIAGLSYSEKYMEMLHNKKIDAEAFTMDILILLETTYQKLFPYHIQVLNFENTIIKITLNWEKQESYLDIL